MLRHVADLQRRRRHRVRSSIGGRGSWATMIEGRGSVTTGVNWCGAAGVAFRRRGAVWWRRSVAGAPRSRAPQLTAGSILARGQAYFWQDSFSTSLAIAQVLTRGDAHISRQFVFRKAALAPPTAISAGIRLLPLGGIVLASGQMFHLTFGAAKYRLPGLSACRHRGTRSRPFQLACSHKKHHRSTRSLLPSTDR